MIDAAKLTQVSELFAQAKTIFVMVPSIISADQRAGAEALVSSFIGAGKEVQFFSPEEIHHESFPESEDIIPLHELGNQNLCVSFEYEPEKVDNVSYHIGEKTGRFYLTIRPQRGQKPLDPKTVEYSYTGAEADLIFTVGVKDLTELEQLYLEYEDFFSKLPIISVNSFDPEFAAASVNTGSSPSVSQEVARLLSDLGLDISSDSATKLLFGIESATKNFSSRTANAETFETVGRLMRNGARRISQPVSGLMPATVSPVTTSPMGEIKVQEKKTVSKKKVAKG
ncbi:MAG: hypothetical protein COU65_03915 [Candidatus Pacebacteria bacterium CG10_big_fil_rev_8_21_14_0_10_42_12]|nr:MAG: hypothetical protein COU65_03915 [Candidatus Pacebacteria bacterium CG10_big_fil_rev_8_21_14_0_10_42_12]